MSRIEARIEERLLAGESPESIAAALGLAVGEVAGTPAVILPGWRADDGHCEVEYPDARSGEEAATRYVVGGDWGPHESTAWVGVRVWRVGMYAEDGAVWHGTVDGSVGRHTVPIEPDEPECVGDLDHDWQSPHELLGGIEENPGVWGHGGGVVIEEVCANCGVYRITDTWAQDPETGEQGLRSVEYRPADADSLRWVESSGDEGYPA